MTARGDIIAVSSAAVCEKRSYMFRGGQYPTKKELYAAHPNVSKETIKEEVEVFVEVQPLGHARQCARGMIQSILDHNAPIKDYRGYVTDSKANFRLKLATIKPYKGNREHLMEHVWRKDIEEFLISECATERVSGIEADDRIAIEFMKDSEHSIVASRDKDFSQLPESRIYDWTDKSLTYVSTLEAHKNFYKQLLTGDTIDNIQGVKGVGPETAAKIIDGLKTEELMMTATYTRYLKAYGKDAWNFLCENARLLWLLRNEADVAAPEKAWKPCLIPGGV